MAKNRQQTIEEQAQREVTVALNNSSGTMLTISDFGLDAGSWEQKPDLGHTINPGDSPSYVNFTDQPFTNLGGYTKLVPTSGGEIDINWTWKWGSALSGSATIQNAAGLSVESQIKNPNTNTPTLQVRVHNASNS
jgi:hypothetical protein